MRRAMDSKKSSSLPNVTSGSCALRSSGSRELTSEISLARLLSDKDRIRFVFQKASMRRAADSGSWKSSVSNFVCKKWICSSSVWLARSGWGMTALDWSWEPDLSLKMASNCPETNSRCFCHVSSSSAAVCIPMALATSRRSSSLEGNEWVCASSRYCIRCSRSRRKV